ncbi:MAG: P-loop NTPase [Chlamydiales bacterium]|nr:P-loop NTPase [Chlamydiia bacterium]MCP5506978.1 P-loop NTPase [Chlamydiales bacterium]
MEQATRKQPLIIAIGGGKGGVGKSMVSSNFAVQYAQAGFKVALVDLDVGAANLHTIFGIRQPPHGLGEYFTTPRSQLGDYLLETAIPNLSLVAGSGFVPELANIKHMQKVKVINQVRRLDADLVLLDLGAGSSINVVDFFSMTNAGIIVTSPEPTAIVNAYEFLKNVSYRFLFRMFRNQPQLLDIIKGCAIPEGKTPQTMEQIIETIGNVSPWAAETVRDVIDDLDFYILFNQSKKPSEVLLGEKLNTITERYLGIRLNYAGMIFYNEEVSRAVLKMNPISIANPQSVTTKTLKRVALATLGQIATKMKRGAGETFEAQYARAAAHAKKDYTQNLLTQRRLMKEEEAEETADLGL